MSELLEDDFVKIILIGFACGALGSVLGLIGAKYNSEESQQLQAGTTMGVGFLVGFALGVLFAIFATSRRMSSSVRSCVGSRSA